MESGKSFLNSIKEIQKKKRYTLDAITKLGFNEFTDKTILEINF
jgi:hypothetical protein